MKDLLKFLAIVLLLGLLRAPAFGLTANDMTTPGVTPAILAAGLMPPGTTTLNAAFTGADSAAGTFSGGLGDGIPIDTGVILTTGDLVNASTTPNVIDNIGFIHALPGDTDLDALISTQTPTETLDAAVLDFDFVPTANTVTFRFVFASDEYDFPDNANLISLNDVFGLFVDHVNIALVPGADPGAVEPVSVFSINSTVNAALFTNNEPFFFSQLAPPQGAPFPTQYDGFTKVLSATVTLRRGVQHHVKAAIADAFDDDIDSAVFLAPATFKNVTNIGTFRTGRWAQDMNGNGAWNGPLSDRVISFGLTTDIPVTGDWTGDGIIKIGVFRSGQWFLDMNGNGRWEGPAVDRACSFGLPADIPVTGDWNNAGATRIGIFRNGVWALDMDGNCAWDGPATDRLFTFGLPGDIPVTGKWNMAGGTKVGVFRNRVWAIDLDGNGAWNPAIDKRFTFGLPSDKPVVGDWNGDGSTKAGVFRNGVWALDMNGSGTWEGPATDRLIPAFGLPTDSPVTGVW